MSNDDEGHAWARVIPEFYYDIIARIPAGSLLVLGIAWVIASTDLDMSGTRPLSALAALSWAPAAILLVLLLLFSYAAGLFLAAIGSWIAILIQPLLWRRVFRTLRPRADTELASYKDLLERQNYSRTVTDMIDPRMHYDLKSKHEQARKILPKMRAEGALAFNVIAAGVVLLIFAVAYWWHRGVAVDERVPDFLVFAVPILLAALAAPSRSLSYFRAQVAFLGTVYGEQEDLTAAERPAATMASSQLETLLKPVNASVQPAGRQGDTKPGAT